MLGRNLRLSLLLLAGCMEPPALRDGVFRCDPADPGTCPPGYHCARPVGSPEHRCYGAPGEGSCGNGTVEPGEECDGSHAGPKTCRDRGYFRGELTCGSDCRLDTTGCVAMTAVAAGAYASCGVDAAGDAWCWGRKDQGQLGAGYVRSGPEPVAVNGGSGFSTITVGRDHACGLGPGGQIWCWGRNDVGQLGDGTDHNKTVAVLIPKPRLKSISAGHSHTCGLARDGRAWCWGWNEHAQLGMAKAGGKQLAPVEVAGGRRFEALDAGRGHNCAIDDQGTAWCWGFNGFGQLGDGSTTTRPQPTRVAGGHTFTAVSAGDYHTCGVTPSDRVLCWGRNTDGQLGDGSTTHRSVPVAVAGPLTASRVAAGTRHTCVLQGDGGVRCWGHGPLGDGKRRDSDRPVRVTGIQLRSLSAGDDTTCGSDGKTVLCWGWNGSWQLGSPRPLPDVPQPVVGSRTFERLAAGELHTCALDGAGKAWCWGFNGFGNLGLGDGNFDGAREPVAVKGGRTFVELSCGEQHSCALDESRGAWCWGNNERGQLGTGAAGDPVPSPTLIGGLQLVAISGGSGHTCGIDEKDAAWCWGANQSGQLGTGSTSPSDTPQPVAGGHSFARIAAGGAHSCGIDKGGTVRCWGRNTVGQLGNDDTRDSHLPVMVDSKTSFETIAAGRASTCAISDAGHLYCWGDNLSGQTGIGAPWTYVRRPTRVQGNRTFKAVAAAYLHTCALDTRDRAWCWGTGREAQLGTGSETVFVPEPVNAKVGFTALAVNFYHSCGVDTAGHVRCWGDNGDGQLGVDHYVLTPTAILGPRPPEVVP